MADGKPQPRLVAVVTNQTDFVKGDVPVFHVSDEAAREDCINRLERFLRATAVTIQPDTVLLVQYP